MDWEKRVQWPQDKVVSREDVERERKTASPARLEPTETKRDDRTVHPQ